MQYLRMVVNNDEGKRTESCLLYTSDAAVKKDIARIKTIIREKETAI